MPPRGQHSGSGRGARAAVVAILPRVWLPLLLFLLAAGLYAQAGGIQAPGLQAGQLAPSFWPRAMLLGLMLGCLAKLAEIVRAAEGGALAATAREVQGDDEPVQGPRLLVGAILLVLGYVLATDLIGFAFATVLFLPAFTYLGGWRRKLGLLLLGIGGTVGALVVFVKVVYLPLPKGQAIFEDLTIALYRFLRFF